MKVVLVALVVAVLVLASSLVLSLTLSRPEPLEEVFSEPEATATVSIGSLESEVELVGWIGASASPARVIEGIATRGISDNASLFDEGDLLLEVEGMPLFLAAWEFPPFRSFGLDDTGSDVAELQAFLNRTTGSQLAIDGVFGTATEGALSAYYGARGYPQPRTGSGLEIEEAEEVVRASSLRLQELSAAASSEQPDELRSAIAEERRNLVELDEQLRILRSAKFVPENFFWSESKSLEIARVTPDFQMGTVTLEFGSEVPIVTVPQSEIALVAERGDLAISVISPVTGEELSVLGLTQVGDDYELALDGVGEELLVANSPIDVKVRLTLAQESTLVPSSTLFLRDDGSSFVVRESDRSEIDVRILATDGNRVAVEGVATGTILLSDG